MSIFKKVLEAGEMALDQYLAKAKNSQDQEESYFRRGFVELAYGDEMQYGWKEKRGLVGPNVLSNMARKDSVIAAIIQTRTTQISQFAQPQKDRYSPGFRVIPKYPADFTEDEKTSLSDPSLSAEDYDNLKYELEQKRMDRQKQQKEDVKKITKFLIHCGIEEYETDTTHRRWDFDKFLKVLTRDRLIYNYGAIELVPTKDRGGLHHFYPVSAGTIRYVSQRSSEKYQELVKNEILRRALIEGIDPKAYKYDGDKPFKYVQVVRGRIVAAWTEDEMVFEPANPTVDPEDNGYAIGELETLIQIVTAHLLAEAHNRNFFTQGIGTKGILHIKGDNISRSQLESFKRQWFAQLANSKNAFRPPIIGMADDVRWVSISQTNREMEFEQWMNYLIRISCAIYQIDPAEINFDISKINTSTLNETSNEERLKSSRDKGLRPVLDYLENLINRHILPYWDLDLASKYEFKFVGLRSETRLQEIDRLQKETQVWKTINEARIEMGYHPIEDGDMILNASYTQYKQMRIMKDQGQIAALGEKVEEKEAETGLAPKKEESPHTEVFGDHDLMKELDEIEKEAKGEMGEIEQESEEESKEESEQETKKSNPLVMEYYYESENKS